MKLYIEAFYEDGRPKLGNMDGQGVINGSDWRHSGQYDAPAWMRMDSDTQSLGVMHAIHCAVDGVESPRLPDDWIYEATVYLAYGLADRARYADDADELRDAVHEIADSQVDVSTSDLATWVAAHGWNAELVNEAIRERGNAGMGLHEQLAMGQYLALERIAYAILELCEEQANA